METDKELSTVVRAGCLASEEEALREAVQTLFAVNPHLRLEAAIRRYLDDEMTLSPCRRIGRRDAVAVSRVARSARSPDDQRSPSGERTGRGGWTPTETLPMTWLDTSRLGPLRGSVRLIGWLHSLPKINLASRQPFMLTW
jgi:hypothetical protein